MGFYVLVTDYDDLGFVKNETQYTTDLRKAKQFRTQEDAQRECLSHEHVEYRDEDSE